MKSFPQFTLLWACAAACGIAVPELPAQPSPLEQAGLVKKEVPVVARSRPATEPGNLFLRAVTFQVPSETALLALDTHAGEDTALFNRLTDMVASGEAEIMGDQSLAARSSLRTKAEAISELIHPTEWDPYRESLLMPAVTFDTRDLGETFEAEGFAGAAEPIVDVTVAIQSVRWKRNEPAPLLLAHGNGWADGQILQPLFVTRKIETSLTSVNGAPILAGILPAGDVYDGGLPTDKGARLTFVIAQKAGSNTPKIFTAAERANLSPPIRVHTLGFRVPGETAALWLAEPAAGDAAWLDHALSLVREGKAALIHHAACGTRSGQRCRTNGFAELIHFPKFTVLDGVEARYTGSLVEFEPVMGADMRTLDVTLALEEAGRPREDQTTVSGQSARLKAPVFPVVRLQTSLTVGLGEVRLLGVAGASPDDALNGRSPGTTDVYFFKSASPSPGAAPDAGSRSPETPKLLRVIASLYSLNEQEGEAAQSALDDPDDRLQVAEEIESRWREETCPLLTQAALTTRSGAKVKLESGADRVIGVTFGANRKPRAPLDPAVLADGPPLMSSDKNSPDTLHRTTGLVLTATPILDADRRQATFLAFECRYDAAPARWPTHMRLPPIPAGEENTPAASFSAIDYLETFTLDGEQTFTVGEPHLVGVQPSRAPSGPEAGRWHALVVRVDVVE